MTIKDFYKGFQFIVWVAVVNGGDNDYFVGSPTREIWDYIKEFNCDLDEWEIQNRQSIPSDEGVYELRIEVQRPGDEDEDTFEMAIMQCVEARITPRLYAESAPRPLSKRVDPDDESEEVARGVSGALGAFRFGT